MYFDQTVTEVAGALKTDKDKGLIEKEAESRLAQNGPNALKHKELLPIWRRFLKQFEDFMIWILLGAAFISFLTHEVADGFIILAIVILNGVLGFVQENNAEKSMQALKNMQVPTAQLIRNGQLVERPSPEIVLGDLIQLNAGDVVPADGRLVEAAGLRIEESQLTGESLPVDKKVDILEKGNPPLGDRQNMVYSTSRVTAGRGRMLVTAVGMETEIGQIANMLSEEKEEKTPLQIKLAELGKMLGIGAVAICLLIFGIGFFQGRDSLEMMMVAISLAVAAIPEGLPAIVTIVLAMGVKRMIKAHAIVRKLPAIETLGAASVICSDKTGTLTENKMTVVGMYTSEYREASSKKALDKIEEHLIKIAVLCNDGAVDRENGKDVHVGDPTETALIAFGLNFEMSPQAFSKERRVGEIPFDSERKRMTTFHESEKSISVYTKGAPDQILSVCNQIWTPNGPIPFDDEKKKVVMEQIKSLSGQALRVLAFASKSLESVPSVLESEKVETNLNFVGLVAMMDPPRQEVKPAIQTAKNAGVRTVMITGDYKDTAVAIAEELGILELGQRALSGEELNNLTDEEFNDLVGDVSVYARVSPAHKVRIVKALKSKGEIVAMTGDGVNDAPALKGADIGCAMGITGTDVSKEASDVILTDDNFATIVSAVREGRTIYDNIKKAVNFLLASNMGEIFTLLIAIILGLPTPLLAIHILWINLVTDSFPALALGTEKGEPDIMQRRPRDPKVSILGNGLVFDILLQGVMIGVLSLLAFSIGLKHDVATGRTMTFLTLSLAQLVHSFNVRSRRHSLFKIGPFTNKRLVQGVSVSTAALFIVYAVSPLRSIFKLTVLSGKEMAITLVLSIIPLLTMEVYKRIRPKNQTA